MTDRERMRLLHQAADFINELRGRACAVILTSGKTMLVTGPDAVTSCPVVHQKLCRLESAMIALLREEALLNGVVVCAECEGLVTLRNPSRQILERLRTRRSVCGDCHRGKATFQRIVAERRRLYGNAGALSWN